MHDKPVTSDPAESNPKQLARVLGVRDVVWFTVVAVFGIRTLALAAGMGQGAILLWLIVIAAFFIPLGMAVTELGTRDLGEGGFYRWTRDAFGNAHGFLAGWFYWVSNVTYLPMLLSFTSVHVVAILDRSDLGENPWAVGATSIVLLWLMAWANVRGLRFGRLIPIIGATAAWIAVGILLISSVMMAGQVGSATSWNGATFLSIFKDWSTLGNFGTLAFALGGLELIAVMGGEVHEPRQTLPRALLLAALISGGLYVAGTVAVLALVPPEEVNPISGILDALQAASPGEERSILRIAGALLIVTTASAGCYAWLGGVARLPFAAGLDQFVPPAFGRIHRRYGTPYVAILVQAGVTTVLIVASQSGSSVREAYRIVLDMSIILNFVPYLYIFWSVPILRPRNVEPGVARIPGGSAGLWCVTLAGSMTTILSIIAATIPASDIENPLLFEIKIWGGLVLFGASGYLLYWWRPMSDVKWRS